MGGSKRNLKRPSSSSTPLFASATKKPKPFSPPLRLTADDLTPILSSTAAATTSAARFLLSHHPLLLPSQTLTLASLLRTSASSLHRLLSLLPNHPLTVLLDLLSPSPPLSPPSSYLYYDFFRVSKSSFDLLLATLTPFLDYEPSYLPLDRKLGAALYRLAHAAPYALVARRLDLPEPAAACRAFYEVCRAVTDHLAYLIEPPVDDENPHVLLPNCYGALGFARFPIGSDGLSIMAQGMVNPDGEFFDISVGWHGSMAPAKILRRTRLYKSQAAVFLAKKPMEVHGGTLPKYVLGGSCCPLLPWLLTPYKVDGVSSGLSSKSKLFNSVHARGMGLVNQAFWRVRSWWRLLGVSWKDECAEALPYVVVAGCLLHNFLLKCGEPMPEESEDDSVEPGFSDFEGKGSEGGESVREVVASHLIRVTSNK